MRANKKQIPRVAIEYLNSAGRLYYAAYGGSKCEGALQCHHAESARVRAKTLDS
jgi:hypothetical protein